MFFNFNHPSKNYSESDSQQKITPVSSSSSDQHFNFFKKYANSSSSEADSSNLTSFQQNKIANPYSNTSKFEQPKPYNIIKELSTLSIHQKAQPLPKEFLKVESYKGTNFSKIKNPEEIIPNQIKNYLNDKQSIQSKVKHKKQKSSTLRRTNSFEQQSESGENCTLKKFGISDFDIGRKMGKGMFGEVRLARHKQTGWVCGLKIMQKRVIIEENYVGQIARQLSIQFYLKHKNILQLYGYFEDDNFFYLLVELCLGQDLYQRNKQEDNMSQKEISIAIRQICEGVNLLHRQLIIHRDLKPQNILFNFGSVKICDFGWAVYRGYEMRKTTSGSPLYYSPQIIKGQSYDDKIDIWCIGMIAYECIVGKPPFKVYTENDLGRIVTDNVTFPEWLDVSEQAKDFIWKALKKNPNERMQIYEMLSHPFIEKYKKESISPERYEQFRRILN